MSADAHVHTDDLADLQNAKAACDRIRAELGKVIVGQEETVRAILAAVLAEGHSLIIGVPGLAKTLLVKTLATVLGWSFKRVQFTPDMMPADVIGMELLQDDPATGRRTMHFTPGPIFAQMVLADEINRTPPKTQAALLQAMQEGEVTVGRETYKLKPPFYVVATQNPIEMEGTYPLPEAQLDRFMFNLKVQYPTVDEEVQIIKGTTSSVSASASAVLKAEEVLRLQELVRGVPIADSVVRYAARLVSATRPQVQQKDLPAKALDGIHKYISYGASPRASQFLVLGSKARAILSGRYNVDFADLQAVAHPVLRHRLVLNFHARADNIDADTLVNRLLESVPEDERKR
ncbi:MAG TPA: MoxR family ATPase [Planctomycetaceae bacterium]|nr:MoxR family ATPase [Planctomycetaceae bacterium]